jgi:Acetoacetate decarboxylase (ADC)
MSDLLGFESDPAYKYDMPMMFGSTEIPDVSRWGRVEMVSTSFVTTFEAVRPFVPAVFEVPAKPIVTVSRMTYGDVDYLGGRGYHELTVGISALYSHDGRSRRGSFMPVVWVDDVRAIIIGREYMGYPKLGAELPPVARTSEGGWSYRVSEYGTSLVNCDVSDPVELTTEELDGLNRSSGDVTVFAWKHIAGPGGAVDVDYPTRITLCFEWAQAFRGEGGCTFSSPEWRDAPHSCRILGALAELPVLRRRPALVAEGTGSIDRNAVVRLAVRSSAAVDDRSTTIGTVA